MSDVSIIQLQLSTMHLVRPYGSNPNQLNIQSHDNGNICHLTSLPPPATNVLVQLEGGSRSAQHIPTPAPPRMHVSVPRTLPFVTQATEIYLTGPNTCNYISPEGVPCRYRCTAMEWMNGHVMAELDKIECGLLDKSRATILATDARLKIASEYKVFCPHKSNCDLWPGTWLVLPHLVMTHVERCAKRQKILMSEADVKRWCNENMTLFKSHFSAPECRDAWESAIWRIYHAH